MVCQLLADAGALEDKVGMCLQSHVVELVLSQQRVAFCSSAGTCCCSRMWSRMRCGETWCGGAE